MSEKRLRELLSVLPDEVETGARAARARRRALARLEAPARARPTWRWVAAAVLVVLVVVGGRWLGEARRAERNGAQPSASQLRQERLELHLVLSDGTRVQWIFVQDFNL